MRVRVEKKITLESAVHNMGCSWMKIGILEDNVDEDSAIGIGGRSIVKLWTAIVELEYGRG